MYISPVTESTWMLPNPLDAPPNWGAAAGADTLETAVTA